jgi:hypothetical protein
MVTLAAVTVCPRLSSRPVPACKLPNRAVVYQSVCHGLAGSPDSANGARCGLSPLDVPPGPNAAALTGATSVTGTVVGAGCALGRGPPGGLAARVAARPEEATADGEPPTAEVSRMATKVIAPRQSTYMTGASHRRQLPPRGLRGGRSSSSSSVTGLPEGWAASYSPTSPPGSAPTTSAIARMCPRA